MKRQQQIIIVYLTLLGIYAYAIDLKSIESAPIEYSKTLSPSRLPQTQDGLGTQGDDAVDLSTDDNNDK